MGDGMQEIDAAVVQRMVKLVRGMAEVAFYSETASPFEWHNEARAIAALLPKPVDPVVLACREIAADVCAATGYEDWRQSVLRGELDDSDRVRVALAAYHAGEAAAKAREESK